MTETDNLEERIKALMQENEDLCSKIEDLRREIERLKFLAHTDPLTGVLSRYGIGTKIEEEIAFVARHPGTCLCVTMLDIDHFKNVNDTYGHPVGDMVLRGIGEVLKRLRKYDVAGRYGGEEFIVILRETEIEDAQKIANRLREAIKASIFHFGGQGGKEISVTASFGAAQWKEGEGVFQLIERVDRALYRAKKGGRDRVEVD